MSQLNILIVEDEKEWRDDLEEAILTFWDASAKVNAVADPNAVTDLLDQNAYDMAIIDLSLSGTPAGQSGSDKAGMSLLRQIRQHPCNQYCVIIVYSGYSENEIQREVERELGADAYLIKPVDKVKFNDKQFVRWCRETLFDGRLKRASDGANGYNRLTYKINREAKIIGYELLLPGQRKEVILDSPIQFDSDDLTRRGDNLNRLILTGVPEVWRSEVDSVGRAIQQVFENDKLLEGLSLAQNSGTKKPWITFSGPAKTLGAPFELWQSAGSYLCRRHPLTRRYENSDLAQNTLTFHGLLETLRNRRLRVLVVGSNSDGNIPAVDQEAEMVAETISEETKRLGLDCYVKLLKSDQADFETVCGELKNGRFHVFHYAGHGRHNDKLPEIGGLVLKSSHPQSPSSNSIRTLTAAALNQLLVQDTPTLQLIFLSCCLAARTSTQIGYGEFHGTLEALAKAGVPTVLGYRWTVRDDSALNMARTFYQSLWRTFSPGEALLEARGKIVVNDDLNNETWASPILLDQSA